MNTLEILSPCFPEHFMQKVNVIMISASFDTVSKQAGTECISVQTNKQKKKNQISSFNMNAVTRVKLNNFTTKKCGFPASLMPMWILSESHGPHPEQLTKNNNDLVCDAILSDL